MMTQLDFFEVLDRPAGEVVALPPSCWGGTTWRRKVHPAAEMIVERPNRADMIWTGVTRAVREELTAAGASAGDIEAQVTKFHQALTAAVCRRSSRDVG